MQIYRVTYIVLALVIITGTVSLTTRKGRVQTAPSKSNDERAKLIQREEENKKRFPVADFDEPEPSDPQKRAAQRQTKAQHNKFGLVDKNRGPDSGGGAFLPEGQFDFPALPIGESDAVVLGEVVDAQAHLSEDKSNVYSEFTIRIDNVFKSGRALAGQITVERIGGYVRYPDGRKLLYRLGTAGMPRVGGKYLLFLKNIAQTEDLTILTGYELGSNGMSPLDSSGQFEAYRGVAENLFLADLNSALVKTSKSQE
jgi:hypothetical protein